MSETEHTKHTSLHRHKLRGYIYDDEANAVVALCVSQASTVRSLPAARDGRAQEYKSYETRVQSIMYWGSEHLRTLMRGSTGAGGPDTSPCPAWKSDRRTQYTACQVSGADVMPELLRTSL